MATEVKVPVLPESVSDATIAAWHKKVGDAVKRDENLMDLETDKVVLEVPSPVDGVLKEIKFKEGDTVTSQQLLAIIEEGAAAAAPAPAAEEKKPAAGAQEVQPKADAAKADAAAPASTKPAPAGADALPPGARFTAITQGIDPAAVEGTGRRGAVTKEDLVNYASGKTAGVSGGARPEERVPMTRIRTRIAERLMQSKNSIAMLTSFNEVNLAKVMEMRKELQDDFVKANGIKLGFMSFFAKAAANALQRHPIINASVDGNDIIYHGYADISIAVSTDKGLVTPVLRNVERMGFGDIEKGIAEYAKKARDGKLGLEDLQGGTFTITNGGTFGSLMSTPIVNPPQSAILGMHAIKDRAIVENGQVVAAPMMYIALSYDHRIIDGKDAVLFLVDIKNQLENPHRMLLGM
ncbi:MULTISPECIES: dihydrolipoyllysine-residue succinyltransferase [Pseudoxanthomonas]|jgi:2-oxoglutarate dehydrogenase E2 component (dihydrolipoamide succinyltransferase)|uniref:Dihydrolipoyllysine-residue succinyltransferase component of 2-oxoglutarate dehydrogenase complex n=1 Tax=Pseudoxanthomonas mexicana TaxID=128785 RepID=A0A7G6UP50_PSEMX|nr:dihydrolipoyllysine-residue succinyltransferase [Pseudoxanthomonas mexicana]MBP7657083.1 dihydrolipoyllysine-residue succinyltransferase [Pseudoxanthomonas sp.]MCA0300318.1 dihydrolipoyllysine-residue succinyltransferase [Pseudomonadota bacterium]QLQ29380.1 MAG: dihydrolipoyllysine-residue succinyltransferase [Pseudoxanthomonas sp.]QND80797.1 dihydrolipoyllysine-residue succinyltransferase [Pseudoxanthomonas mexicana]QNN76628.1 dihydrolipoyllysine-residue succinyltransferase [Pseudoxanthomo